MLVVEGRRHSSLAKFQFWKHFSNEGPMSSCSRHSYMGNSFSISYSKGFKRSLLYQEKPFFGKLRKQETLVCQLYCSNYQLRLKCVETRQS